MAIEKMLPLFNTSLILVSGVFLIAGFYSIRRRRNVLHHKRSMITATIFAGVFLVVYVYRAIVYGGTPFGGTGWLRALYLSVLGSHVILATVIAPLALVTLYYGWVGNFVRHRRIARVTFPTWLYVVATGWIIYWMLHQMV